MPNFTNLTLQITGAIALAMVVCLIATPLTKRFAEKVGAIDVPKDNRRIHALPIPRLGGLAIFVSFILSVVVFAEIDREIQGILFGSILIVSVGVVDDIIQIKAIYKFLIQVAAALIPIYFGVRIDLLSNPNIFAYSPYLNLGWFAIPLTLLWIVGITNAVNLIDGLDGLAVGVSTISSVTMLIVALFATADANVAVVLAALTGACIGFMPYNLNPAKIFMGDTGALLLGYLLSTMSIVGLFKSYAIISFAIPFLVLALPIFDTTFAIFRRVAKGKSPMQPDRGHLHHRLIDLGFSQKQAVFIIYLISGVLGLLAVTLISSGEVRTIFTLLIFFVVFTTMLLVFKSSVLRPRNRKRVQDKGENPVSDSMESEDSADNTDKPNSNGENSP